MACSSFSASSATRLQAVDAAAPPAPAVAMKSAARWAPPAQAQRSLGSFCSCRAARQEFEGATQDPAVSVSSARTQLDLLEQLTSQTSDGIGPDNNGGAAAGEAPRPLATIREQLSALYGDRGGEFTLPLGKKLKEGLKSLSALTVSQRRNIKRQALLTRVSGRNDSVFFATVGAFVLVPPFAILAIAVLTGYVQLLP